MWTSQNNGSADDGWGSADTNTNNNNTTNSCDDGWGATNASTTNNGQADSGWGSVDTSSNNDNKSSGGWGSSGGGGGNSGQKGCFNCGESGHMSRECPKPRKQGGGGGGGRSCYNCGDSGHMSRECPQPKKQGGGGGGGGGRSCFNCGDSGHMSRECPQPRKQGGGGGGGQTCFNCGEAGHMSRDCSKPKKQGSGGGGGSSSGSGGWGSSTTNNDTGGWGSSNTRNDTGGWGSSNTKNDTGGWGSSTTNNDTGGWGSSDATTSNHNGGTSSSAVEDSGWGTGESKNQNDNAPTTSSNTGWGDTDSSERGQKRGSSNKNDDSQSDGFSKRPRREEENGDAAERPAPFRPEELNLEEEAELQNNGTGENFKNYSDQKVICFPKDLISPIEEFEDIVKSELLLSNIKSQGFKDMTPIQKWAMPAIMEGHDLIGCAQTGSGKTAAFLLPVLQTLISSDLESHDPNSDCQYPYCLIISPTRELANQIHLHSMILSKDSIIKCHVIYGQISTAHLKAKLSTGCHVLVATPGRLKDFVERGWIGFKNIKYIILDEGDRLVDEGFTGDIKNFFENESMPPKEKRQTLFFSATFRKEIQISAAAYLKNPFVFITVGRVGGANKDIKQEFLRVSRADKKRELKKILSEVPETDKCIVFTQTKNAADMLAGFFTALNLSSTSIHGDRHQSQREQAIKSFKKGQKRFLISSPVGNRGLDLPLVALVINYDMPNNIDEYVHRIGRTGRAGHIGRAISFYDEERDQELKPQLLETLKEAQQEIPDWMSDNCVEGGDNESGEITTQAVTATEDEQW